jgi:hypothetical protein
MEELKELINIVDLNKVRSINIIGDESFSKDTNLNKLYHGILSGDIVTEKDAMAEIGLRRANLNNGCSTHYFLLT